MDENESKQIDNLVNEVIALRTELKDWKQELIEEFNEMTGMLVEYYQQVVDKHLLHKQVDDYFDGQTIASLSTEIDSSSEESSAEEDEEMSMKDKSYQSNESSMAINEVKKWPTDDTNELDTEVD